MATKKDAPKVKVRTPNKPGYVGSLDKAKYDAMKAILLKVIPRKAPGVTQNEMFAAVAKVAPKSVFPGTTSAWWSKGVQLDLEARGLLERDEGKPLRWRRRR